MVANVNQKVATSNTNTGRRLGFEIPECGIYGAFGGVGIVAGTSRPVEKPSEPKKPKNSKPILGVPFVAANSAATYCGGGATMGRHGG
jgi:hypothetical protein